MAQRERLRVLQISSWDPPASGWVSRIKLLRRTITQRGGVCEILDIGPSRRVPGRDCICVQDGMDYLKKVLRFARQRFTIHAHINGKYFRGQLLALAALIIGRACRNRCIVTFHAGTAQPLLEGWKRYAVAPITRIVFLLAHAIVCNSEAVKKFLSNFASSRKIFPIPAFSGQYLEYRIVELEEDLERFMHERTPLLSTYVQFRQGFYTEVLIEAMGELLRGWPNLGLVVIGTGDGMEDFRKGIVEQRLTANCHVAGNREHDEFMTILARSGLYVRTPPEDGVSSSVLEALSLGVPVVASENGTRPPSVITYEATNARDLANTINRTLSNYSAVVDSLVRPEIADTAAGEVDLIEGTPGPV